jgi:hypothetical protein
MNTLNNKNWRTTLYYNPIYLNKNSSSIPFQDYVKERGNQINVFEEGGDGGTALNPLDMHQVYDTDFFEPETEHEDKENHNLDSQDRNNNLLWM